jgi:hypothetical protein
LIIDHLEIALRIRGRINGEKNENKIRKITKRTNGIIVDDSGEVNIQNSLFLSETSTPFSQFLLDLTDQINLQKYGD